MVLPYNAVWSRKVKLSRSVRAPTVTAPLPATAWPVLSLRWPMVIWLKPSASARSSAMSRLSTPVVPTPVGEATAMAWVSVVGRSVSWPWPRSCSSLMRRSISSASSKMSPAAPAFRPTSCTPPRSTIWLAPRMIRSPPLRSVMLPPKVTMPVASITRSPSTVMSWSKLTFCACSTRSRLSASVPSSPPPTMPATCTSPLPASSVRVSVVLALSPPR